MVLLVGGVLGDCFGKEVIIESQVLSVLEVFWEIFDSKVVFLNPLRR